MSNTPQPLPDTFPADSLFGFRDRDEACFDEIEDAVRTYVEAHEQSTVAECIESAKWPIIVDEFKRMPKPTPERMLERFLEEWHENFGDPDLLTDYPAPYSTPEKLAAMKVILDGLEVWGCEETGRSFTITKEDALRMLEGDE